MTLTDDSRVTDKPQLQVRINQIDYTLITPGSLDNSTLPKVPVLRIFGTSSVGRNTCVHVHQVYPYFFVHYRGNVDPHYVKQYISKLFRSLNHAIALSLRRNPNSMKSHFIRAILLVKGIDFYGFHASYSPFLKILVTDPAYVTRIVTILQSGSVMGTRFTVYESHLSYILQFLADFGLYGCGVVEMEEVLERCPEAAEEGMTPFPDAHPVKFDPSPYFRQSHLPLEVDVIAPHLMNRRRLSARNWHHKLDFSSPKIYEPLVPSVSELWEDERNRRRALGLNASPELSIDISTSSRSSGGEWVAEARWWDEIRQRIEKDKYTERPQQLAATNPTWDRFVMTTFESIEAIWEIQYRTWKPIQKQGSDVSASTGKYQPNTEFTWDDKSDMITNLEEHEENIDVDISMLSNQEMTNLDQEEAQIWHKDFEIQPFEAEEEEEERNDGLEVDENLEDFGISNGDEADMNGSQDEANPFLDITEAAKLPSQQADYQLASPHTPVDFSSEERSGPPTPTRGPKEGDVDNKNISESTSAKARATGVLPIGNISSSNIEDISNHSTNISEHIQIAKTDEQEKSARIQTSTERSSFVSARAVQLSRAYESCKMTSTNQFVYSMDPPSRIELRDQLQFLGLPNKIHQVPFYSKDHDVPETLKEYAGLVYRLKGGQGIATLDEWSTSCPVMGPNVNLNLDTLGVGGWEFASQPPSSKSVRYFLDLEKCNAHVKNKDQKRVEQKLTSQIEGPTQFNIHGFKTTPTSPTVVARESANMSVFSLEVFAPAGDNKAPNSESDEIVGIFYAFHVSEVDSIRTGILAVDNPQLRQGRLRNIKIETHETELDLINKLVDIVIELDPDIVTGWEVQLGSWGYLQARGSVYGLEFSELISRAPPKYAGTTNDQWGYRKTSTFKVAGRHVLNLWRIMRSEKILTIYTFENVVFEVLKKRIPKYSYATLTDLYFSEVPVQTSRMLSHLAARVRTNLELLEETETVTKTAEFARVFGVDFFSVLSRGSQFKVESFMFRIAKPESYVLISPSKNDVGKQNAAECMPLIMEPASAFYSSPLLVLDFQSLYPSIMIAYNYCYSTCLGRVTPFKGTNKFGVVDDLDLPPNLLESLKDDINVSPNGMIFVKSNVRKGLLGRMLTELLDTRVMVKQAMKRVGNDKVRKRILDARQLSLKYIANVTYGYTSASFSGRMPAVEIADSIVQSGRETLEKAVDVIDNTHKWGARVVYGDTDSVFVSLPGKSKEEAFAIGNEIAETITAMNPAPIKLKFEKVYHPCVLMAKKRYVGFKYENIDDVEPVFDAKGIETVRRDGILAQRKMVETCLKILFRTQDLSEVKDYCCRSWSKILDNRAPVYDFIFAKEVKMGTYSNKGPPPPGVMVAARKMVIDSSVEAQYGDRIPYVIARSKDTGARLVDRAIDPLEFMNDSQLQLDSVYYITRVLIPPLERIFNLVGADVKQWFNEMPKHIGVSELKSPRKTKPGVHNSPEKENIDIHFYNARCLSCEKPGWENICEECFDKPQETIANLGSRIRKKERHLKESHLICSSCTGAAQADLILCESLDCPWFYARRKVEAGMELVPLYQELIEGLEATLERNWDEYQQDFEMVYTEDEPDYESEGFEDRT